MNSKRYLSLYKDYLVKKLVHYAVNLNVREGAYKTISIDKELYHYVVIDDIPTKIIITGIRVHNGDLVCYDVKTAERAKISHKQLPIEILGELHDLIVLNQNYELLTQIQNT